MRFFAAIGGVNVSECEETGKKVGNTTFHPSQKYRRSGTDILRLHEM
jgi:hypothetical protein